MLQINKITYTLLAVSFFISVGLLAKYLYTYENLELILFILGSVFIFLIIFLYFKYNYKINTLNANEKSPILDDLVINSVKSDYIKPLENIITNHKIGFLSIGLIGAWGSGKSSFIQTLNHNLTKDTHKININVWELGELDKIINEIEKELDNIIFEDNPIIWLSFRLKSIFISNYFSILSKYTHKSFIDISLNQTIHNAKKDFSDTLIRAVNGKRIVLFIDEVDRLDTKEEIVNVFKAIRYTTSFDNITTITAIDLKSIEKKLENIDYIHKVFNIKYSIPKTTTNNFLIYYDEIIKDKLSPFVKTDEFMKLLKNEVNLVEYLNADTTSYHQKSIIDTISNYREIKNSYNDTYILCNTLKNKNDKDWDKYIDFKFIFILNLIKAIDYEMFIKLNDKDDLIKLVKNINFNNPDDSNIFLKENKEFKTKYELLTKSKNNIFILLNMIDDKPQLAQYLYIYQHYEIYDYLISNNDYKSYIDKSSKIDKKYDKIEDKELFLETLLEIIYIDKDLQRKIHKKIINISIENHLIKVIVSHIFIRNIFKFRYDYTELIDKSKEFDLNNYFEYIFGIYIFLKINNDKIFLQLLDAHLENTTEDKAKKLIEFSGNKTSEDLNTEIGIKMLKSIYKKYPSPSLFYQILNLLTIVSIKRFMDISNIDYNEIQDAKSFSFEKVFTENDVNSIRLYTVDGKELKQKLNELKKNNA